MNCKNKTKNNKLCWRHKKNNKTITEKGNCINVIPNEIYMIIYEYLEFNDKIEIKIWNETEWENLTSILKKLTNYLSEFYYSVFICLIFGFHNEPVFFRPCNNTEAIFAKHIRKAIPYSGCRN